MSADERDFLSRWSRRKRDARSEPEPAGPEAAPPPVAEPDTRTDEEVLAELGLPDPETLGPGSDFKAFMAHAVPERIRRRALRKLWLSNPVLANLDEMVDYGEDYTDAALVVANLQSAYQAGRGYLDRLEKATEAEPRSEPAPADRAAAPAGRDYAADGDAAEARAGEASAPDAPAPPGAPGDAQSAPVPTPPGDEPPCALADAGPAADDRNAAADPSPVRRRMRFRFDTG